MRTGVGAERVGIRGRYERAEGARDAKGQREWGKETLEELKKTKGKVWTGLRGKGLESRARTESRGEGRE